MAVRILILNQTFHPDVAAEAQYASDLAASLTHRGHAVTVLCGRRSYTDPTANCPARENWRGVEIRRVWNSHLGWGATWRHAVDMATFVASCALHLCVLGRFDLVIGLTSPPPVSWLGALFARLRGGRFIFWVMDLNPDRTVAAGQLEPASATTRWLEWMLRDTLHRSSQVVVLDRFVARRLVAKGVDPDTITVIPPWSLDDAVTFDAGGRARFRAQHGLSDKFVVMYSGNHSPCHPLTTLLQAAERLRDRTDIAFCFIGGGSEVKTARRFVAARGLRNVMMLPYQPLRELSASLSSADLHAVVMGDPFVGIIHPSKVYNIRAVGIPYLYIGPADSHIAQLDPAYSVRHGDVDAAVRHIETAAAASAAHVERAVGERIVNRYLTVGRLVSLIESVPQTALNPVPWPSADM